MKTKYVPVLFMAIFVFCALVVRADVCPYSETGYCEEGYLITTIIETDCSSESTSVFCERGCTYDGGIAMCYDSPVCEETTESYCFGSDLIVQTMLSDCTLSDPITEFCEWGCIDDSEGAYCFDDPACFEEVTRTCDGNTLNEHWRFFNCDTADYSIPCAGACITSEDNAFCGCEESSTMYCDANYIVELVQNSDCSSTPNIIDECAETCSYNLEGMPECKCAAYEQTYCDGSNLITSSMSEDCIGSYGIDVCDAGCYYNPDISYADCDVYPLCVPINEEYCVGNELFEYSVNSDCTGVGSSRVCKDGCADFGDGPQCACFTESTRVCDGSNIRVTNTLADCSHENHYEECSQGCLDGNCICTPQTADFCYDGDIVVLTRYEDCSEMLSTIEECSGFCEVDGSPVCRCLEESVRSCDGDQVVETSTDVYCDSTTEIIESCDFGCSEGRCNPAVCIPNVRTSCDDNNVIQISRNADCSETESLLEECEYFCAAATCMIPTTCADTDNGINLAEKGAFLNSEGEMIQDYCLDHSTVRETVCTPGCNCQMMNERCKEIGTYCDDGKCVLTEFESTESDSYFFNEYNIFQYGETTRWNGEVISEFCVDENTVFEDGIGLVSKEIKCPVGTTCVDGACIGSETVTCNELIPGHNDPHEKRYNLVFVGQDYHEVFDTKTESLHAFISDSKQVLGIDSHSRGVFSFEPFKSNIDKFNFWYVDHFVDADPSSCEAGTSSSDSCYGLELERRNNAAYSQRGVASACSFSHKIILSLDAVDGWNSLGGNRINFATYYFEDTSDISVCVDRYTGCFDSLLAETQRDGTPIVDLDGDGCISFDELEYPQSNSYGSGCQYFSNFFEFCSHTTEEELFKACKLSKVGEGITHELSHYFGLTDIAAPRTSDSVESMDYIHPPNLGTLPNCFVAESSEDCETNTIWRWLLGNGCGEPGIIDCAVGDPGYEKEITCYPGCEYGINSYRSIPYSIMPYGLALDFWPRYNPHTLGEWNEYYISQKINTYLDTGVQVFAYP